MNCPSPSQSPATPAQAEAVSPAAGSGRHTARRVAALAIIAASLALVVRASQHLAAPSSASDLAPARQVYDLIVERFYRDTDASALQIAMIRGMTDALEDPYTEYVAPQDVANFEKQITGSFVGVGVEVGMSPEGWLQIISPIDDSPAIEAGLQAEDLVVAVDGRSVWGQSVQETIDLITGRPGTEVVLTIERAESAGPPPAGARAVEDLPIDAEAAKHAGPPAALGSTRFEVTVDRRPVQSQTVRGLHRDGEEWRYFLDETSKIAYIRVSQFTDETRTSFPRVIEELMNQDLGGLILDLRSNTGGSLYAAIEMADLFIDQGTIVSTQGRAVPTEVVEARPEPGLPEFPMIVLVNGGSASASEIVSGALADSGRAKILGERTFGKGLVQSIIPLPGGLGELKITEAEYRLPSGRSIHREDDDTVWGVDPTPGYYLPVSNREFSQMWTARRREETRRPTKDEDPSLWSDPTRALAELEDPQLEAAYRVILGKLTTGEWVPPVSGEDQPEAMVTAALRTELESLELLEAEAVRIRRRASALAEARGAANGAAGVDTFDLLPDNATIAGGTLEIRDAQGTLITTLRIGQGDIERWLIGAPLSPMTPAETDDTVPEQAHQETPR